MAAYFPVQGVVTRVVTEVIDLSVKASSEQEAIAKAAEVLETYPMPHKVPDVPYCYVAGRHTNQVSVSDVYINYPGENDSA